MSRKQELLNHFQRELQLRNYASKSIETYTGYLNSYLIAMDGKKRENIIDETKSFLLSIINTNTRAMYVNSIRNFFKYCLKKDISLEDIPYPRKTHYLPNVLSINEVALLLLAIDNQKHRAIIQLMYSCALRISEVSEIETNNHICHIDSDRQMLLVKGAKGFKDRYVPIPKQTLIMLRNYRRNNPDGKWLFMGQNQQKYSARSIQSIFKKACIRAGIKKKVTPHSLRHSRLTHLCEAGMDIYKLKEMAGHNHIKTTEIYLHLSKSGLLNAMNIADAILSQTFKKQLAA